MFVYSHRVVPAVHTTVGTCLAEQPHIFFDIKYSVNWFNIEGRDQLAQSRYSDQGLLYHIKDQILTTSKFCHGNADSEQA